jgi:hypothetical protein
MTNEEYLRAKGWYPKSVCAPALGFGDGDPHKQVEVLRDPCGGLAINVAEAVATQVRRDRECAAFVAEYRELAEWCDHEWSQAEPKCIRCGGPMPGTEEKP